MRRVKIVSKPKAKDGAEVKAKTFNGDQQNWPLEMNSFSTPSAKVNTSLKPVPEHLSNMEAEKGENAVVNQDGIPTNFKIAGKRHSEGGTPLNLPKNSFIFSDTKAMKIKDPTILAQFGITGGVHTPADIAKKYDVNKFRAILADNDSSDLDRSTAEMMIANYNLKLAKLALVQESKKGFPQGIPAIAIPYIESMEINPDDFLNTQSQKTPFNPDMTTMAYGGNFAQMGLQVDIEKSIKEKEAAKKAYQQQTHDYFMNAQADNAKYRENAELHRIYDAMKERYKAGDLESKWYEIFPGVHPSAQSYLDQFKDAAIKYGHNPDALINQFDIESGYKKPETKAPAKVADKPKTESKTYDIQLSPEEAKALGLMAYGGYFQQGGGTGNKTYKLTQEQLEKLNALRSGKGQTAHTTTPAKPKAKTQATSVSAFDAYGPGSEELMKYIANDASLRSGKVSTRQSETAKGSGLYGDAEISVDQFLKNNPTFAKKFEESHPGQKYDPKNKEHVQEFQQYYNPNLHQSVYDKFKKMGKTDEQAKQMADLAVDQFGFKQGSKAREYDKMHGQFTGSRVELQFKDPEVKPEETVVEAPVAKEKAPFVAQNNLKQPPLGHDPWWLQDIIKTAGATGDFYRVKKYAPWQATPGVNTATPTFYDPTRELAANAEMANIGTQGLGAFTNPQAFNAGFSQIQGQGAKNAADIMGRYNNMNVGTANDFEIKNTDIMNNAAANLAGLQTQLFDKYTIMNQQFDNSKNMARQNLRQSYIDAITNKNNTANLNDLYDQYKIDPLVGGRIKWTHGRPITPEADNTDQVGKINRAALEFMKQNPGLSRDKALESAMKLFTDSGSSKNPGYDPRMGYPG